MVFLYGIADESNTGSILFAAPPTAIGSHTLIERLLHLGIGEGLSPAIVPSEPGKRGQVLRQILLDVQADPVLAGDSPGMVRDVRRSALLGCFCNLIAVNTHISCIGI